KASFTHDAHAEDYNSEYKNTTLKVAATAANSDYAQGRLQTYDIWRYRVYGGTYSSAHLTNANGYYEIDFPGPKLDLYGDANNYDWYQPDHENGNVLSYPPTLCTNSCNGDPYLPPDVGTYTLPDGTQKTEPMVPGAQHAFDGASGSIDLEYSDQSGASSS